MRRLLQALATLPPEHLTTGDRLRLWREERGESQGALAGRLGISQAHLSRIECGEREPGADLTKVLRRLTGIKFTPVRVEPRATTGGR